MGGRPGPCVPTPGCLPPSPPAAFQEIFKLFSSGPTGSVDMRSIKATLRNVGIQLSPQEMCKALQQADLDGGRPPSLAFGPPSLLALDKVFAIESPAPSCFRVPSSKKPALMNTPIP